LFIHIKHAIVITAILISIAVTPNLHLQIAMAKPNFKPDSLGQYCEGLWNDLDAAIADARAHAQTWTKKQIDAWQNYYQSLLDEWNTTCAGVYGGYEIRGGLPHFSRLPGGPVTGPLTGPNTGTVEPGPKNPKNPDVGSNTGTVEPGPKNPKSKNSDAGSNTGTVEPGPKNNPPVIQ
jgi:hypothetical protein